MTLSTKFLRQFTLAALLLPLTLTGCKSAQQKANDAAVAEAKQQAASSGVAQQVVTTDKDGSTVTTVVQPPVPGQTTQKITVTRSTTTTKTTAAAGPVITPAPSNVPVPNVSSGPAPVPSQDSAAATPVAPAPDATSNTTLAPIDVQVPRGTTLAIRVNQRISVKTAHAGDRFSGEVVRPVSVDGRELIPHGTPVEGVIDESHRRGHFKGRSILELRLISMRLNGTRYSLDTHDHVDTKKGKGKRSAAFIGGDAGAGMLIGGIATGGVGLVVGGLIGAGGGTLLGGLTGNRDLVIPAESVVSFKLADDLVVQPQ